MSGISKIESNEGNENKVQLVKREDMYFEYCMVRVRKPNMVIVDLSRFNEDYDHLKASSQFVVSHPLMRGDYYVEFYGPDFVILKNKRNDKRYLNNFDHFGNVRCSECWGRGYMRTAKKRSVTPQGYKGVAYDAYSERECNYCEGSGIIDGYIAPYPSIKDSIEYVKEEYNEEIDSLYVFEDDKWCEIDLSSKKKGKNNA